MPQFDSLGVGNPNDILNPSLGGNFSSLLGFKSSELSCVKSISDEFIRDYLTKVGPNFNLYGLVTSFIKSECESSGLGKEELTQIMGVMTEAAENAFRPYLAGFTDLMQLNSTNMIGLYPDCLFPLAHRVSIILETLDTASSILTIGCDARNGKYLKNLWGNNALPELLSSLGPLIVVDTCKKMGFPVCGFRGTADACVLFVAVPIEDQEFFIKKITEIFNDLNLKANILIPNAVSPHDSSKIGVGIGYAFSPLANNLNVPAGIPLNLFLDQILDESIKKYKEEFFADLEELIASPNNQSAYEGGEVAFQDFKKQIDEIKISIVNKSHPAELEVLEAAVCPLKENIFEELVNNPLKAASELIKPFLPESTPLKLFNLLEELGHISKFNSQAFADPRIYAVLKNAELYNSQWVVLGFDVQGISEIKEKGGDVTKFVEENLAQIKKLIDPILGVDTIVLRAAASKAVVVFRESQFDLKEEDLILAIRAHNESNRDKLGIKEDSLAIYCSKVYRDTKERYENIIQELGINMETISYPKRLLGSAYLQQVFANPDYTLRLDDYI
jgi:hypothetical protein